MESKQNTQLRLKYADLKNRRDLADVARMEIELNLELRPRFKFDFSDSKAFEERIRGIKNVNKSTRIIIAHMAYSTETPAGYVEYFLNKKFNTVDGRLLYVYPEFRRMGVGSALVKAREEEARQGKYSSVKIDARAEVEPFFRENGFTRPVAGSPFMIYNLR